MASYNKQAAIGVATAAARNCTPVGQIFSVENDSRISTGQLLCSEDILEPAPEAKVIAVCFAEGTSWEVPSGIASGVSNGCYPVAEALDCDTDPNGCIPGNPRPSDSCHSPEIMSPALGEISNTRPFLSWKAVPGATRYTVRLQDITGSGVAWEIEVTNINEDLITVSYPENEDIEPLKPGEAYELKVEASIEPADTCIEPGKAIFILEN